MVCTGLKGDSFKLRKFLTVMPNLEHYKNINSIEVFTPPYVDLPLLIVAYEGNKDGSQNAIKVWRPETQEVVCQLMVPRDQTAKSKWAAGAGAGAATTAESNASLSPQVHDATMHVQEWTDGDDQQSTPIKEASSEYSPRPLDRSTVPCRDRAVAMTSFHWRGVGYLITAADGNETKCEVRLWRWVPTLDGQLPLADGTGHFELLHTIEKSPHGFNGTVSSIFVLDLVPFNPPDCGLLMEEDPQHPNRFLPPQVMPDDYSTSSIATSHHPAGAATSSAPSASSSAAAVVGIREPPQSPWIIFGSYDKSCSIWAFENNEQDPQRLVMIHRIVNHLPMSHTDLILSVTAFQHGRDITVVTASWDKTLRYWTYRYQEKDHNWHHDPDRFPKIIRKHTKSVTAVVAHTFRIPYEYTRDGTALAEEEEEDVYLGPGTGLGEGGGVGGGGGGGDRSLPPAGAEVHRPGSLRMEAPKFYYTSKVLITGSLDTTALIWDLESGEVIRRLVGHEDKITALRVFDTEMKGLPPLVITASEDRSIIFWNLLTGDQIRKVNCSIRITSLEIFPVVKGFVVAAGGGHPQTNTAQVLLVNMQRAEHIRRIDTNAVTAIDCYYPRMGEVYACLQRPLVAIGTIDKTCKVYDYQTNRLVATLSNGHEARINAAVVYTPRDPQARPLLVTAAADKRICVWDLTTFTLMKQMVGHHDTIFAVAIFNPDLVVSAASPISLHNGSGNPQEESLPLLDLNEPLVISGGRDDYFLVWNLCDPLQVKPLRKKLKPHQNWIRFISVFHPTHGQQSVSFVTASYDTTVRLWDLTTLSCLREFRGQHKGYIFGTAFYDPFAHYDPLNLGEHSPPEANQNVLLVTVSYDKTTVVWDVNTGVALRRLRGHIESITAVAIHTPRQPHLLGEDAAVPLIVTCAIDKLVIVWNLLTGERLQTLVGHTDRVCFLTIFDPYRLPFTQSSSIGRSGSGGNGSTLEFPTIISGGDDHTNIIWEDTLYPTRMMPTRDNVNRAFACDLQEDDWPLITRFALEFDGHIFLENPHLFQLAVRHQRPDFLLKFRSYLTKVLPYMTEYEDRVRRVTKRNPHHRHHHQHQQQRSPAANGDVSGGRGRANTTGGGGGGGVEAARDPNDVVLASTAVEFAQAIEAGARSHINHHHDPSAQQQSPRSAAGGGVQPILSVSRLSGMILGTGGGAGATGRPSLQPSSSSSAAPDWRTATRKKLLYHAIIQNDLIAVRAILLSWTEIINHDVTDMLSQRLYHPSYFFPDDVLRMLASVYPLEFMRFITALRLIRNHPSLLENERLRRLNQHDRLEVTGAYTRVSGFHTTWFRRFQRQEMFWLQMVDFFDRLFLNRLSDEQPITSMVVPLKRTSNLHHSLAVYVHVCNQLSNVTLFDSEVGTMTLQYCWEAYGRSAHLFATCVYVTFLALFILCIYAFQFYYRRDQGFGAFLAINIFNGLIVLGFVWYLLEEMAQIVAKFGRLSLMAVGLHVIRDAWNGLDCVIISTGLTGMLLRMFYQTDTAAGRCILAVCSVAMWCKVLYYMRPFSTSGPLVAMIVTIVKEIRIILLVLFFVLCGFTQALWLISNQDPSNSFGTVSKSFYNSFLYMFGQIDDTHFEGTVTPAFAVVLLVFFMMVMMILMLNLLIALMGDAFTSVREQGLALWRKEQATIILEQHFSMSLVPSWIARLVALSSSSSVAAASSVASPRERQQQRRQQWWWQSWLQRILTTVWVRRYPPYLHVLKYTSDVSAGPTEGMLKLAELVETSRPQVKPFSDFVPPSTPTTAAAANEPMTLPVECEVLT